MTIHDVRFSDEGSGINVCCMSSVVDPWKVYGAVISKSNRLSSFMQQDSVIMNLGYVTNIGTSKRKGFNIPGDDIFTVEVLVRMADIDGVTTIDGSKWYLKLGVSNDGEVVSVGQRELTVKAAATKDDRVKSARPLMDINMTLVEDKVFVRNDIVEVQGIMAHMFKSRGEGRTTFIRYLR